MDVVLHGAMEEVVVDEVMDADQHHPP